MYGTRDTEDAVSWIWVSSAVSWIWVCSVVPVCSAGSRRAEKEKHIFLNRFSLCAVQNAEHSGYGADPYRP
eukprot:2921473-Rhodomonas_salina.2